MFHPTFKDDKDWTFVLKLEAFGNVIKQWFMCLIFSNGSKSKNRDMNLYNFNMLIKNTFKAHSQHSYSYCFLFQLDDL